MDTKGKMDPLLRNSAVLLILVLAVGIGWTAYNMNSGGTLSAANGVSANTLNEIAASAATTCPTSGVTAFTLDVANYRNETGAEGFDVTAYVKGKGGSIITFTDTTSPSAQNLNCGEEYTVEIIRTNANDGDSSRIATIINGGDNAALTGDGTVKFVPAQATYSLRLGVAQHGVLEFRAYDNDAAGFACNGDDTCVDFETDGVSFTSTTNGTAKVVGTGGQIDYRIEARSTLSDTDFNDYYTLIMVEAPTATWNEPVIKVNGEKLTNVKGSGLTAEEAIQFSGYEYIYKFDKAILDGGDNIDVDWFMTAKAGVNPSTDPEIDFASAGRYLALDGVRTKVGAADDTSSNAVVYDVQDVTLDIS